MGITKVGEIAVSSLWGGDRVNFENAEFEITISCAQDESQCNITAGLFQKLSNVMLNNINQYYKRLLEEEELHYLALN